jgi:hypothetical protein
LESACRSPFLEVANFAGNPYGLPRHNKAAAILDRNVPYAALDMTVSHQV